MKKWNLLLVIIFGINAAVWSGKAIYGVMNMPSPAAFELLRFDAVCAVCWTAAFAAALIKIVKSGRKQ